jgi:hypothetical protein
MCPTHYAPAGKGDVLDIVVNKNVQLSEVIISDILDSDHIRIVFHLLEHVTIRNILDLVANSQIGSSFKAWPLK